MAATEAEVCNIALLRIGIKATIDDLDEESVEAEACKSLFDTARDVVLEQFDWPFARRFAQLATITGAERTGWGFVYALPGACIAARKVLTTPRLAASDQRVPFETVDDASYGRVLVTDLEDAELQYTHRNTTVAAWSPLFQNALAWYLAADLALALPVKPGVGLRMEEKYKAALAEAIAAASRERTPDEPPASAFERARE